MARLTTEDLLARAEITDTAYAYCRGIDRRDFDLLADLFTEDAAFDYGHGNVTRGRENLLGLFAASTGKYTSTSHHCSTVAFHELTGQEARTTSYVYAFHEDTRTDRQVHVWGCYADTWRNEADRWRITERRVRVAGVRSTAAEELPDRFERYPRA